MVFGSFCFGWLTSTVISQLSYIISCAGNLMESKVWKASFWMRSYLAPSMKRTFILTNQRILTRLATEAVTPQRAECQPTTRRYKDKNGKTRYVGTSTLKSSQNLTVFEQMVLLKVLCSPPKTLTVYFHMLLLQVGDLHLRIYTGRFAKAVMTLYPGVVQSPPLWPQEVSRQSIKTGKDCKQYRAPNPWCFSTLVSKGCWEPQRFSPGVSDVSGWLSVFEIFSMIYANLLSELSNRVEGGRSPRQMPRSMFQHLCQPPWRTHCRSV